MDSSGSSVTRRAGNIAGEFIEARVAAFGRANGVLRLCKPCLDREVRARRLTVSEHRMGPAELFDPLREWCFLCGVPAPTLPALPRAARPIRRAAA